jgi:predicted transposase YbfD/YdcC
MLNIDWLRQFYPFKRGIPSHDTLNRVFHLIPLESTEYILRSIASLDMNIDIDMANIRKLISIDGKSLARSATIKDLQTPKANGGKTCKVMVNAYCHNNGLCIMQKTTELGGEQKSVLEVLDEIPVTDNIILLDAGNTAASIVDKIWDKRGYYVIALKANCIESFNKAKELFEKRRAETILTVTKERSKGRDETRQCSVLNVEAESVLTKKWTGICSLVEMVRTRKVGTKETTETMYYISSMKQKDVDYQYIIRTHWGIENKLHWRLDVILKEDYSKNRIKNCAANLAAIRRIALNALQRDIDKISTPIKMAKFRFNPEYRNYILGI